MAGNNCKTRAENGSLRLEAKSFDYDKLNEQQKKSFEEIFEKIKGAAYLSNRIIDDDVPRYNRVVFLSGGRGTGKTSLLLTLKRYLNSDFRPENPDNDVLKNCSELRDRLIWLETLDMEPLPGPVNLLAAILARVEYAVERYQEKDPCRNRFQSRIAPLESVPEYRKVIMDMQHLQQDVTLAWEGNIYQQAPNIDPDTFATEVFRAERNRIDLNKRFGKVLKDLSQNLFTLERCRNPIFILPIDDFDLNPLRCLELLRLIRMMSSPHLFSIILGDISITKPVFNSKIISELLQQSKFSSSCHSSPKHIETLANNITSNAIRKLIPPSHVVKLGEVSIQEAFKFNNETDKKIDILKLFKQLPVQINTAEIRDPDDQVFACKSIKDLRDFFNAETILETEEPNIYQHLSPYELDELSKVYSARNLVKIPYRHIRDMWRCLDVYVKDVEGLEQSGQEDNISLKKIRKGLDAARGIFHAAVWEDENLTMELAKKLTKFVTLDFEGNLQIDTTNLHAENVVGPEIEFQMEGRSIVACLAKDWRIGVINKQKKTIYLNHSAAAATVFIHDLLALRKPRGIVGKSLVRKIKKEEKKWVYAKWDLGGSGVVSIPWLAPPWLSFWEHDFLRRGWNDSWMWLRYAEPKLFGLVEDTGSISVFLAFVWIKIGTILLKSTSPEKDAFYDFRLPSYEDMKNEFGNLKNKIRLYTKFRELFEELNKNVFSFDEWKKKCEELATDEGEEEFHRETFLELENKLKKITNCFDSDCRKLIEKYLHIGCIGDDNEYNQCKSELQLQSICAKFQEKIKSSCLKDITQHDYWNEFFRIIPPICYWLPLVDKVNELAKESDKPELSPRRRELIRGWLARIACMLAPESGIPAKIVMLFFLFQDSEDDNKLLKLWMEPDMARQIRTIRAKSAVEFLNRSAYDRIFDLFRPQKRKVMMERTERFHPWWDKEKAGDCKNMEIKLDWLANYTIRQNAINILGNEMLCPIFEEIQSLCDKDEYKQAMQRKWESKKKSYRIDCWGDLRIDDYNKKIDKYNKKRINFTKEEYCEIGEFECPEVEGGLNESRQ